MLDNDLKGQLKAYLERLQRPVAIVASVDDGDSSKEMLELLEDIRAYRERNLARIGWQLLTPLFGRDTAALAREMIDGGLRADLCCVDTRQLDAGFAGRAFDHALLDALPGDIDPCGENGEFHTCVRAGPMFDAALALSRGETELRDGRFAFTDYAMR